MNNQFDVIGQVLVFIEKVLDRKPISNMNNYEQSWKTLSYMKSWVCNLLYVIMGYSYSKNLANRISEMLFNRYHLLSLLGELLSYFG